MKTIKFLALAILAAAAISLTSCKKEESTVAEIETTFEAGETQARADNVDQDVLDITEEAAAREGLLMAPTQGSSLIETNETLGRCAVITVTGSFPAKNIKIDFGTGCTSPRGITRKGVVNILLTNFMHVPGSVATITFDNYYVNDVKKEGTITHTNTTVVSSGTKSWNRVVAGGKLTFPTGRVWLHSSNLTVTQIAGVVTPFNLRDDVFTIEGTKSVTNAAGATRTSTTQTPLQKKTVCDNIDSGILKVEGPNHTALINFGDGRCDNLATISINGRPERTIILR